MSEYEDLAKEFGYQPSGSKSEPLRITVNPASTQYEDLAKEFGYDPAYKESEKPIEAFWQGLQNDPTLLGAIKRFGIGALRGNKDVIDTGAEGLAKGTSAIADKILPEDLATPIRQSKDTMLAENKTARDLYNKEYPSTEGFIPSAAEFGRVAGNITGSLPLMPTKIMGAIDTAAGALPTLAGKAAPFVNRLMAASGKGAVGGGIIEGLSSSKNDKSLAENIGTGLLSGALGGPIVEGGGALGQALGSKVIGGISSTRAALAERAQQLGIELKGSQVSDSHFLQKLNQVSGWLPFSGEGTDKVVGQFHRAISKTFGKDTEEITPALVKQALTDTGAKMNTIKQGVTVDAGTQLQQDFIGILRDATSNLQDAEVKPIFNNLRSIAKMIDPNSNTMTADVYHNITKYDGLLSKLQNNSNPNIANAANQIRTKLEDALERSMTPQQLQEWRNLKLQYKSGKTVQELLESDRDGTANPLGLLRKVVQSPGGKLGAGDLGELADIGREFFKQPADSGTPLGNFILKNAPLLHNPISALSAGTGALLSGAPLLSLIEGGIGLAANRGVRSAINSKFVRDSLINSAKGKTQGVTNTITNAIEPYSAPLLEDRTKSDGKLKLPVALEN